MERELEVCQALCRIDRELTLGEVLSRDQQRATLPPLKPKGGEVFLFFPHNEDCNGQFVGCECC